MNDEEKEIAELILGIKKPTNRISTLQLALESAKFHLGIKDNEVPNLAAFNMRHNYLEQIIDNTPIIRCSDESEIFTALFISLNILEQIGILFCPPTTNNNNIDKALDKFTPDILPDERKAIQNLRNSLAHNFGLVNYNTRHNRPTLKYIINIGGDKSEKVVQLPRQTWDGNYANKSEETSCIVNVFPLMKLVHQIINGAITHYNNDTLSFAIEDLEEIKARFTIIANPK